MNKTGEPDDRHDARPGSQGNAAVQYESTEQQQQASVQRRHGRALPKP
jgi:hypothetical protein